MKSIYIDKLYYILLGLFMASFTIPSYSFNTQCFITLVFVGLFLKDNGIEKIKKLKKNYIQIFLLSIPFIIAIFGLLYTNNLKEGFRIITTQLPFLLISLTFLSTGFNKNQLYYCLKTFSFSVVIYNIIVFCFASYLKLNDLGIFFYYDQYGYFFGKHTTYTALFIIITISFLSYLIKEDLKRRINLLYFIIILFLCLQLYFLSVRIAIISLFINLIFIVITIKHKVKYIVILGLISSSILMFFLPNFKKRFLPSMTEVGAIDGLDFRKEHWLSVLETIKYNGLLFGGGTGNDRNFLIDQYKDRKLTSAYLEEYNAHNQYLEIILNYGLLGFACFIFLLLYLYYYQVKYKDILTLLILNTFVIFFITESLLIRQSGIMLFAILTTLIINKTINNLDFGKNKTL